MKRRKLLKTMIPVLLATSGALPGAIAALAQGDGPDTATPASGEWTAIEIGGRAWYSFEYDGEDSEIVVRLACTPKNSVAFSVWTPENVAAWGRGAGEHPIGRGAVNGFYGGDQVWVGSFNSAGTYYVVVDQTGLSAGSYSLQVTGDGVSFSAVPAVVEADAAPTEETAGESAADAASEDTGDAGTEDTGDAGTDDTGDAGTEAPEEAATGGTGPADALTTVGGWTELAAGQRTWYAFEYDGGGSSVLVRMAVSASGAAAFSVWTTDNIHDWVSGKPENPVGKGTVNSYLDDDLSWAGSFTSAGTYYIVVDSLTGSPSLYHLQITGDGVHLAGA